MTGDFGSLLAMCNCACLISTDRKSVVPDKAGGFAFLHRVGSDFLLE